MQGIYIAAMITTLVSVLLIGGFIFGLSRKEERPHLLVAFLFTLPMSALAFHLLRMPFDRWLADLLAGNTELLGFLRTFYAPLTEEPAKLWPLLIPWFLRRLKRENFVLVALALGLGFGVSEAWLIAELIARHNPETASMPWYALGGYINERAMVCIMHGFFTSVALFFLTRPWRRNFTNSRRGNLTDLWPRVIITGARSRLASRPRWAFTTLPIFQYTWWLS